VIQSVEVMLLSWTFLRWVTPPQGTPHPSWIGEPEVLRHLAVLFIAWAAWGIVFKEWPNRDRRVHYAWHLFFWFVPVVVTHPPVLPPSAIPNQQISCSITTFTNNSTKCSRASSTRFVRRRT
jgi:hypothetical protein